MDNKNKQRNCSHTFGGTVRFVRSRGDIVRSSGTSGRRANSKSV